ncbi:hypothetical protein PVAND_014671 [Polypedilum vanderplanki]|uniref:Uncharacterized protein n=1 Tax=Polypedilum vanderplanki TaxID=319348 RepID=A0A9J6BAP6_POLVA|nr:hypothetical protein PVAND_014671 [Polypedilum vanderplanki]
MHQSLNNLKSNSTQVFSNQLQSHTKQDRIVKTVMTAQVLCKMPQSLLFALTFILTFSVMMQCCSASIVEEQKSTTISPAFLCKKQKCENGCSALPVTHATSHADLILNSFTLTSHDNATTSCICPSSCEHEIPRNCTIEYNQILQHGHEMKNPLDPCETFVCLNGKISIHMAVCASIHCPVDQRIKEIGKCCEACDPNYSNFCDDDVNRDCEWHCRYGYVYDEERSCDLCSCMKPPSTATTTTIKPTITEVSTTEMIENDEEQQQKTFFIFLDSENEILNILIVCVILMAVTAFGIFLVFMIWFLHRRIYNRVPLISHGSWKGNNQYA